MSLEPGEELLERREGRIHRLVSRLPRPSVPPGRGSVILLALLVLSADLAVMGVRMGRRDGAPGPSAAPPRPGKLPRVEELDGKGPFVLYGVENAELGRTRVFAADLGSGGDPRSLLLGDFPGLVTQFAGGQGQAAGNTVPLATLQDSAGPDTATRVWLLKRRETARAVVSTFDFVSAFALDPKGTRLAVSRRSAISPLRGSFLWLYALTPPESGDRVPLGRIPSRQVGSLRRPGGSVGAQLRPVAWARDGKSVFAIPFCDECAESVLHGVFKIALDGSGTTLYEAAGDNVVFAPSFSTDASRFVFQDVSDPPSACRFSFCTGERRLLLADTDRGTMEDLARSQQLAFDDPVLSSGGKLVAYATGRNQEIVWMSVETGRVLGSIDGLPGQEVVPAVWLSDREIIAVVSSVSVQPDGPTEASLVRITRATLSDGAEIQAHVEVLATARTISYLGWIR